MSIAICRAGATNRMIWTTAALLLRQVIFDYAVKFADRIIDRVTCLTVISN